MSSLALRERDTYDDLWSMGVGYETHSPGAQYIDIFMEHVQPVKTFRGTAYILDAGCGSGKGAVALAARGCQVTLCDLTNAGLIEEAKGLPFFEQVLWQPLDRRHRGSEWDFVYCCDVMEHIPPQFTMLVVQRLLSLSVCGVFFSISLQPDVNGVWVGKPLHQTVQSFTWWRDNLRELGDVVDARDLLHTGLFMVKPR